VGAGDHRAGGRDERCRACGHAWVFGRDFSRLSVGLGQWHCGQGRWEGGPACAPGEDAAAVVTRRGLFQVRVRTGELPVPSGQGVTWVVGREKQNLDGKS